MSQSEQTQQRPVSDIPTTSSIYSQAPLDPHQHYRPIPNSPNPPSTYSDVSPPDSPEMNTDRGLQERYRRSPSISPIEESFEIPDLPTTRSYKYTSNIPILRREKRRSQGKTVGNEKDPSDEITINAPRQTRWNDFTSNNSNTHTTRSGGHLRDPRSEEGKSLRIETTTTGGRISSQETQAYTNPNSGGGGFGLSLGARGDWRGAMGRFSRSSPTDSKTSPSIEPIPRSANGPSINGGDGRTSRRSDASTTSSAPWERDRVSLGRFPLENDDDGMKPIVPLKAGRNSPPRILTSPTGSKGPTSVSSRASSDPRSAAPGSANRDSRNKPLPTPVSDDPDSGTSGIESKFRNAMKSIQKAEPTTSRFSATTYATSTTYDTPPTTPKVDSPSPDMSSPPSPILSRRRPIPTSNDKAVTRKPPPSQEGNSPYSPAQTSINHSLRNSKMLPQSPPEAQSVDLITTLQAQLDDLHTRRANLQKILRELSLLLPPNPSTHNASARGEMKKRVDDHKMELAEIQKEEHDIGLRLHRAWRRRDKLGQVEEPTGLWVRRVTG
ncbi:hypothetical protein FGG08_002922 [Glutinoglossum americanum]|uniref:Uncharacterized protein n=1 Tax=Glutinoglossum americanum TaxID=1670608 RepID=A0A9P8L161_9PEZI|nr:hypothetical protein FGG08_002922 [Glutinoglossum americanum]